MPQAQTIALTRHAYADGSLKRILIDGKWVEAASGKTFESRNPATGELLATIAEGDAEDINRAVSAARRAFEGAWGKFKPYERQQLLLKFADLVERHFDEFEHARHPRHGRADQPDPRHPAPRTRHAALLCRPSDGDPRRDHPEFAARRDFLLHAEGAGRRRRRHHSVERTARRLDLEDRSGARAGCAVILKPAEEAPLTSLRLGELALEAGVPPGVINVVPGYGETAGAALAGHMGVDKVAFTGSHFTGQAIVKASAGNLKRVSLELGGKSPDIVFADADLEAAVPGAAMAVFANSGQICSAGTRLFVEQKVYDQFIDKVAAFGKGLRVGNGLDPETQIGPLVSEQQLERVTGYLVSARKKAPARSPAARD